MRASPLRRHPTGPALPPWWLLLAAAAFVGYFALLIWTDLHRPEAPGIEYTVGTSGVTVLDVEPGSPAARAGLRRGDRIVEVNGLPISGRASWQAVDANLVVEMPLLFVVARGTERLETSLAVARAPAGFWMSPAGLTLAAARVVQSATLLVALIVAFTRTTAPAARLGAWLLASIAVYSFAWPFGMAANWRALPGLVGAPLWLPFASTIVAAPILFTVFANFPLQLVGSGLRWAAIWAPALAVGIVQLGRSLAMVYGPHQPMPPVDWTMAGAAVTVGYSVAAAVALATGYRRVRDITLRRRVRVLAFGSLVGVAGVLPVVISYNRPGAVLEGTVFASPFIALSTVAGLAMPISFAYATLRHRLFDVGFLVRRSLQYALARGALVSLVPIAGAALLVDLWVNREAALEQMLGRRGWIYAGLAGFALVARVHRQRWLDRLDRRFFRERYRAEELLRAIGDEIRRAPNLPASATHIVTQIETALHPEYVALLTRPAGAADFTVLAAAPPDRFRDGLKGTSAIAALLPLIRRPVQMSNEGATWLFNQLPPDDLDWLARQDVDMIVPVQFGEGSTEALFLLGPRRSEEPYSREDEDLLMTIGHGVALLIGRGPARERVDEAMAECPACGRCYEPGKDRCERDDAALVRRGLPRVLARRFSLERRIGSGGMGTVYVATDGTLGRQVAIKVLRQDLVEAAGTARFQSEARLAASLTHPNVVAVHDVGVTSTGRTFLVMELLEGHTLREEMARTGSLAPDRVVLILRGIAGAIDAAHARHLIHRDLKPENVFLSRNASGEIPKVLDFGLAKALSASSARSAAGATTRTLLTEAGIVAGTPAYMSPEHRRSGEPSPDWDLWAFAVVAFELIAGSRPFDGAPDGPPLLDRLPDACRPVFARALAADPLDRPTSAGDLVADIEKALTS